MTGAAKGISTRQRLHEAHQERTRRLFAPAARRDTREVGTRPQVPPTVRDVLERITDLERAVVELARDIRDLQERFGRG